MAVGIANLPDLNVSIQNANFVLNEQGLTVSVASHDGNPKAPVFLRLTSNEGMGSRNIGIVHLVHLAGSNWDKKPFEEIAKTTDQMAQSILDRVALFVDAEKHSLVNKDILIDDNGTIFDFRNNDVRVNEDKTFSVDGTLVTFGDSPLVLSRIKSESIVEFRKLENGHTLLFDAIDQREGKGMFIDENGKLYRA